ncbi:MAG: DUF927 domain-containing protein [Thermomicrobiales bacterium]
MAADTSAVLEPLPEHIPSELKDRRQWVTWRAEPLASGKFTKIPTIPGTGYRNRQTGVFRASNASAKDPATWRAFDQAWEAYERGEADGLGFVFCGDDPYVGIDLDGAVIDGAIQPWAQAIVDGLASYAETSPSGSGLHIIVRGPIPAGSWANRRGPIECYQTERFFTVTGRVIGPEPAAIEGRPDALLALLTEHLKQEHAEAPKHENVAPAAGLPSDDVILAKARAAKDGADFIALWDGTLAELNGGTDWSRGDVQLLRKLYFWCGRHAPTMKRLFLASGRAQREKMQERPDYLTDRAMDEIFKHPGECYAWGVSAGAHRGQQPGEDAAADDETQEVDPDPGLRVLAPGLGMRAGGFVSFRETEDGLRITPLSNFTFRVTHDVVKEDGASTQHLYEIEAIHQNGAIRTATVLASEFSGMAWVARELGPEWIIYAGMSTRDKVRQGAQHLTAEDGFTESRIFQHAGWIVRDGKAGYLSASGMIGTDGLITSVQTELPGKLALYALPAPDRGAALRSAALDQLKVLELGPARITGPLFGLIPAAILGELHPVDFIVHVYGLTGVFKTETAAIVTRHWGAGLGRLQAMSAHSTTNAMERTAFAAKDAVLLIDDFVPEGTATDQARIRGAYQRLARSAGNGGSRSRMNVDGSMRPDYYPRGAIITTGEDVPGGHSATGRTLMVEVNRGDIQPAILTELQRAGDAGRLALVTASVIQWCAANWDSLREGYADAIAEHLGTLRGRPMAHSRHPETLATLMAAAGLWLDALVELEAITKAEADAAWATAYDGILEAGTAQSDVIRDVDPCDQFLRLVSAAVAAGDVHLCDPEDNGQPANATVCGWTMQLIRTRDGTEPDYRPRGPRIGWIDNRGIFLLPDAALAAAQTLGRSQGISIPWTSKTLGKRLNEGTHLLTTEAGRNVQKIRVAGSFQRVWHVESARIVAKANGAPDEPTLLYTERRKETA